MSLCVLPVMVDDARPVKRRRRPWQEMPRGAIEEGSMLPAFGSSKTNGFTVDAANSLLRFQRIGTWVRFQCVVTWTDKGSDTGGSLRLWNLPYRAVNRIPGPAVNYIGVDIGPASGVNLSSPYTKLGGRVNNGENSIVMLRVNEDTGTNMSTLTAAELSATGYIICSGAYELEQ